MRSFGEWMFDSLRANPVSTVGHATRGELGDERDRTARAHEQRTDAQDLLEGVEAEQHRRRVGRDQPGRARPRAS